MEQEVVIHRGFADDTSFSCSNCQHKCCVDPYPIGLLPSEAQWLIEEYPRPQIMKDLDNLPIYRIYRSSRCPYFMDDGLCQLHQLDVIHKPLSCILYPLIFWQFAPNEWLTVIEPCSDGFRWWDGDEISEQDLRETLEISAMKLGYLPHFLGDVADPDFPYTGIRENRVRKELELKNQLLSSEQPITALTSFLENNHHVLNPLSLQSLDLDSLLQVEEVLLVQSSYWSSKFLQALRNVLVWLGFSATFLRLKPMESVLARLVVIHFQLLEWVVEWEKLAILLASEKENSVLAWRFIDEMAWRFPQSVGIEYWKKKLSSGSWKSLLVNRMKSRHFRRFLKKLTLPIQMSQLPVWAEKRNALK